VRRLLRIDVLPRAMDSLESLPPPPLVPSPGPGEYDNGPEWVRYAAVERLRRLGGAIGGALALAVGLLLLTVFPIGSGPRGSLVDLAIPAFLLILGAVFLGSAALPTRRGHWIARVDLDEVRLQVHRYDGSVRGIEWSTPDLSISVARTIRPADSAPARLEAGSRLSIAGPSPIRGEAITAELGEAILGRARAAGLVIEVEPDERGSLDLPKVYERVSRVRPGSAVGAVSVVPRAPTVPVPTVSATPKRAPPIV
jgi:hypothetical protein